MFSVFSPEWVDGGGRNGHEANSASIKIKVKVKVVLRSKEWVEFDTEGQALFFFFLTTSTQT